MIAEEYVVKLTLAGKIAAWEQAMSEYTRNLSTAQHTLVVAAGALEELYHAPGGRDYYYDAGAQWWEDLEEMPRGSKFVVLTRLARAGVDTPVRFRPEPGYDEG